LMPQLAGARREAPFRLGQCLRACAPAVFPQVVLARAPGRASTKEVSRGARICSRFGINRGLDEPSEFPLDVEFRSDRSWLSVAAPQGGGASVSGTIGATSPVGLRTELLRIATWTSVERRAQGSCLGRRRLSRSSARGYHPSVPRPRRRARVRQTGDHASLPRCRGVIDGSISRGS
jgi:hypothetical protein